MVWVQPLGFTLRDSKHRHNLLALRQEMKLIHDDCIQWIEVFDITALSALIQNENSEFQPISILKETNKSAINKMIEDMPGFPRN